MRNAGIFLMAGLLCFCGPSTLDQAQSHLEAGRSQTAIELLEPYLAKHADDYKAWLFLGEARLLQSLTEDARDAFVLGTLAGAKHQAVRKHILAAGRALSDPQVAVPALLIGLDFVDDATRSDWADLVTDRVAEFPKTEPAIEQARDSLADLQSAVFSDDRAWLYCVEFPSSAGRTYGAYEYLRDFPNESHRAAAEAIIKQGFDRPEGVVDFMRRVQQQGCDDRDASILAMLRWTLPPSPVLDGWIPGIDKHLKGTWSDVVDTRPDVNCRTMFAKGINRLNERTVKAGDFLAIRHLPASTRATVDLQLLTIMVGRKGAQGQVAVEEWVLCRETSPSAGWWLLSR